MGFPLTISSVPFPEDAVPRSSLEVVVASLASSCERRRRVQQMMADSSLGWRFFDALTEPPVGLPQDLQRTLIELGRPMSRSELGTFATHYSILNDFVDQGASDYLLVLEDDVEIDPGFWFDQLPDLMQLAGIEALRLYSRFLFHCRRVAQVSERHTLVRFRRPVFGTQAYLVSRAGARRFCSAIHSVVRPCDNEFDRFWANGLPLYALYPFPVIELEGKSTIHGRETAAVHRSLRQAAFGHLFYRLERTRLRWANWRLATRDKAIKDRIKGVQFPHYRCGSPFVPNPPRSPLEIRSGT